MTTTSSTPEPRSRVPAAPAPAALRFRGLKIAYSWKCNAACEHCAVGAGPDRRETLGLEVALGCIDAAADLGLQTVELTGGEIFLFYPDLPTLVERAHTRGLRPILVTNGFWAKSPEVAARRLKPLRARGLQQLIFSTDRYHQRYVPLERVIHALRAAGDLGISSSVTVCRLEDDPALLATVAALHPHTSQIQTQNVSPFGRAAHLPQHRMTRRPFPLVGRPCHGTDCPTVSPDGRVTLCCAPPMQMPARTARHSPLVLGWLHHRGLAEILEDARQDALLRLLVNDGVGGVLRELDQWLPKPYRPRSEGYFGSCDLCMDVLGRQPMVSRVREVRELLSAPATAPATPC